MKDLSRWMKVLIGFGSIIVLLFLGLLFFRVMFVNHIENYEIGYTFDRRTGQVERLHRTGYVITPPFLVKVYSIDGRPGQVCMNANSRVLNCKLVKFDTLGFDSFIAWHGVGAGEGSILSSSSGGSSGSSGGIYEILKSYAFNVNEGRDCPFLTIVDDMRRKGIPIDTASVKR